MALNTKTIRGRLRSINNTKKITKAMEMVAAVKMRKAVFSVLASRAYAATAWRLVLDLAAKVEPENHPLLKPRENPKNVLIILISGNRGLCGGCNSRIIAQALDFTGQMKQAGRENILWMALGKKGANFLARQGQNIVAEFEKPEIADSVNNILPLAQMAITGFLSGEYDQVAVCYTDFISALNQKPKTRQLLPFVAAPDADLGQVKSQPVPQDKSEVDFGDLLFEPSPAEVLNQFLPRLVEIQIYQALLESNAGEHSARMMAMKNASEAATDMISDLTLIYNQARQAGITREIAEISVGKAVLEDNN